MGIVKKEIIETKDILSRIKRRNFSGNKGKVIKNSSWQLATTLVAKFGSLAFTIIIAKLMMPEIYGLYGLALSTILFLGVFSDFGIGAAIMTLLSKKIDKDPGKAKGYFYFLTKYKISLTILSSIIFLVSAGWVANSYYNKPIYYAILSGAIYIPMMIFSRYMNPIFTTRNDFRPQFIREIIVQVLRLTILPILIIYFLAKGSSTETYLLWVFLGLSFCYAAGGFYLLITAKLKHPFKKAKEIKLNKKEKKRLMQFMLPLIVTSFSGVFFGYVDQIMLGHYVESQFLGFYHIAFSLIASASAIVSFSAASVFPILARLKENQLERAFVKTRRITFLISLLAAIFTFIMAPFVVEIIFPDYVLATNYLRILSLLLISFPIITLYTTYYTSQERTKIISILLILSILLNIILNYILINAGLKYSMSYAVMGVCVSTIISRYSYLAGLILWRRK